MDSRKSLLATSVLLIAVLIVAQVKASPGPTVSLNPDTIRDMEPNSTFTVEVTIAGADNIYGWQVNLTYTPGTLSVTEVTEGAFLKNVHTTQVLPPSIHNDLGYTLFGYVMAPPYPPQGASGSGTLATIGFKVESGSSTSLHFAGGTKLRTIAGDLLTPISDVSLEDGDFIGTGGGMLQLPLEVIAGIIIAVVVIVVVVVIVLKRRK